MADDSIDPIFGPRRRLARTGPRGPVRRVRDAVGTLSHGIDYARHLLQGNRVSGDMSWVRPDARPVILVHGFLGTRGTMLPMQKRFRADGRAAFSYSHGTFQIASIRASAQALMGHLERLCRDLNVEEVDVVGYSMGGLLAMHAIKYLQGHRFMKTLVTLGSPFGGSWVALSGVPVMGGFSPSVWQVLPNSPFLAELNAAPLPDGLRMRQIHAAGDNFCPEPGPIDGVGPRDYIVLPGGHSSLVVAPHFYEAVREFLDADLPDTEPESLEVIRSD